MKAIETFLENWKVKAKQFYLAAEKDYNENRNNFKTEKVKFDGREITITAGEKCAQHFNNKYGKANMQIVKYEMYRIDEILVKEAESKKRKLISDIQKKLEI